MECIVHFTVGHDEGPKKLRGLIFVGEGEMPTGDQLLDMFGSMGFQVTPDPQDSQLFLPSGSDSTFTYIRVNELDIGQEKHVEDRNLKSVLNNLLQKNRFGL
ncbi:hypothetical protein [Paenibacillus lemnae]|nr:hypothetical protein [Paenibacillus lemnae]